MYTYVQGEHIEYMKMSMHMFRASFMFIWNQNMFFWLSVLSSLKMEKLLNQGWSLIDFDDTKTFLICLLIKLLNVSEVYLEPKAKTSLKELEIQNPIKGSKSLKSRIWILKWKMQPKLNPRKKIWIPHKQIWIYELKVGVEGLH